MPAPALTWIPWLLLAGLLLVDPRPLRLAVAGVLLAGLSIASALLVLGDVSGDELSRRIAERGVQPSYLLFNAAILLAGVGLAGAAAVAEWRTRRAAGSVVLALALAASAPLAWPLVRESRPMVALLAATSMVLLLLAWSRWSDGRSAAGLGGAGDCLGVGRPAVT